MYAMGTGSQRLLTIKLTISVTVVLPRGTTFHDVSAVPITF